MDPDSDTRADTPPKSRDQPEIRKTQASGTRIYPGGSYRLRVARSHHVGRNTDRGQDDWPTITTTAMRKEGEGPEPGTGHL